MGLFNRKKKEKKNQVYVGVPAPSAPSKPEPVPTVDDMQLAMAIIMLERDPMQSDLKKISLPKDFRDEDALFLLAMESQDPNRRWEAAGRMEDVERLTKFALEMPPVGPWKIMQKIQKAPDGAERLRKIADEAREQAVRTSALEYLSDLEETPELYLEYAKAAHTTNPLYKIEDAEFLAKAIIEDESDFIRNGIAKTAYGKIPSPVLFEFAQRTDNDNNERVRIIAELVRRGWEDPEGKLDKMLPELMDKYDPLVFEMGKKGDARAVPKLAELSKVHAYSMTAPSLLGNIHTKESVQALLELMQTNQDAGDTAVESLKRIYKNTDDPELKRSIAAIDRKTYFKHIDMGDHGRSCHSDVPAVVFDLEEE